MASSCHPAAAFTVETSTAPAAPHTMVSAARVLTPVVRPTFLMTIGAEPNRVSPEVGSTLQTWWAVASGTAQRSTTLEGEDPGFTER